MAALEANTEPFTMTYTIDPSYDPPKDPTVQYEIISTMTIAEPTVSTEYAVIISTNKSEGDKQLFIPVIFLNSKTFDWETP